MSLDSHRPEEQAQDTIARCKRQADGDYSKLYIGTQRRPWNADEAGALIVVDLVFGGRMAISPDPDPKLMRVKKLP